MPMETFFLILLLTAAVVAVRMLARAAAIRRAADFSVPANAAPIADGTQGRLGAWLHQAGYRAPSAGVRFIAATAASGGLGLLIGLAMDRFGVIAAMVEALAGIPGAAGEVLGYVAILSPYLLFILL